MAYHDDLLEQAKQLVHQTPQTQASLRRAVSAAYYAVFHLLITEATANWSNTSLRTRLGRAYDHGPMKKASDDVANPQVKPFAGESPQVVSALRQVGLKFSQLQKDRHFADYNLTSNLGHIEALNQVQNAELIFNTWPSIKNHPIAQEYLVALLVTRN